MRENTEYFNTGDKFIQWKLNERLFSLICGSGKADADITLICIGTDRSTGDSFGPLTGHMLSKHRFLDFQLYGDLENPVHALTLPDTLGKIDTDRSLVIAIDASVGSADFVGYIGLGREPLRPGSGLGKSLPPIGDISITGIVASSGVAPFLMLQNAPLGMVYRMAEKTCRAIEYSLYKLRCEKYGARPLTSKLCQNVV